MQVCLKKIYSAFRFLATPLRKEWVLFVFMYVVFVVARLLEKPTSHTLSYVFYLENFADLYLLCAALCLIPHKIRRWVRAVVYVVAYAAAFSECFIHERFHLLFGPITIQLVSETTPGETSEFFASYLKGWALGKMCLIYIPLVALNVLAELYGRKIARHIAKTMSGIIQTMSDIIKIISDIVFPIFVVVCMACSAGEKKQMLAFFMSHDTDEAEHADNHAFHTPFYRIVFSTKFLSISSDELGRMRENMRNIRIDSCSHRVKNIVLYIGESYNKHHSQLYGYGLETTPHQMAMAEDGSLIVFNDAVTPWNVTSNVFKDVLSTHSCDQEGSWVDGVLVPGVLKKAGYKVAFITSQYYKSPNQGVVDFNGSFFLNDKEIERRCFDYRNKFRKAYDATLVREIDKFKFGENNFVIFHGMGQHQEYNKRFGANGVHFTVGDYASRRDLSLAEKQIVADYDNATRYNDNVVRLLCERFRHEDAVVVYLPDHGEEVYDRIHSCGRDHNAKISADIAYSEFEVPFEIWFSPKARKKHPELYEAARNAADKPFSTDDLPHLLMGIAGISSPLYDARRDLLNAAFDTSRKRILKRTVDYDSLMCGERNKGKK